VTRLTGLAPGMSIAAARRMVAQAFRQGGLDSPDLDARLLVGHALGLDHTALASKGERQLSADDVSAVSDLATRRLAHEPVARIVGHKEFWGLEFKVTPATLVPRPETETLVEAALAAIPDRSLALRIADFGTGTGALLLALLSEFPNAVGIGTDISISALAVARDNAVRLGVGSRAHFIACDYGSALRGPFDLIISNPPYIASGDIAGLDSEVRNYDPGRALDGGASGLDAYRAVLAHAGRLLAPEGIVVVELGAGQASSVAALMGKGGIAADAPKPDLNGRFRALLGRAALRGKQAESEK
jgi:release factor glutamine methyltransferase